MSEIIFTLQAKVDGKTVFDEQYPDTAQLVLFGVDKAELKVEEVLTDEPQDIEAE